MTVINIQNLGARNGGVVLLWEQLAATNTGEPLELMKLSGLAACVQVVGTFGGTVFIEGSIDGATWATLRDAQGISAETSSARLIEMATAVRFIRPRVGSGVSDVDVYICVRGS